MSKGSSVPKRGPYGFRCKECGGGFWGYAPGLCRFCKRKKDEEREAITADLRKRFEEKYYPTSGMHRDDKEGS